MSDHDYMQELLNSLTEAGFERLIERAVSGAPNLFVVARALRQALKDDWERAEVAELLMEGVKE